MPKQISKALLDKYEVIANKALALATNNINVKFKKQAIECLEMATTYVNDAKHFRKKEEWVLAYGALNYAHGWLDCGARNKFFLVKDSKLFAVDDD